MRDAFARIADRYVLTNHVLSCGMDILWRKIVTARIRKWKPTRLLDVASGTGDLALEIQDQCPQCEVIASDFCAEMLVHAASRGIAKTIVADADRWSIDHIFGAGKPMLRVHTGGATGQGKGQQRATQALQRGRDPWHVLVSRYCSSKRVSRSSLSSLRCSKCWISLARSASCR